MVIRLLFLVVFLATLYGFGYLIRQTIIALPKIAAESIVPMIAYAQSHGIDLPFSDLDSLKAAIVDMMQGEFLFVGIELLSIPLYVLCAAELRREGSLESGLKYLIIGSLGSATLLYGLALLYGATGSTDFAGIGAAVASLARRPAAARRRRR